MRDYHIDRDGVQLHVREQGQGAPIVLTHAMGTDLSLWDPVIAHLPAGLRIIRYDLRGHGQSDAPGGPYSMGQLIKDAETICDTLDVRDCVFVGLSIGGMIAQGLAIKRLDLIRGLVLSNTAAKLGQPPLWRARIDQITRLGLDSIADDTMQHWFSRDFLAAGHHLPWRDRFNLSPSQGYAGCCAAIGGTDFYTPTSGLRLATLGIAGSEDGVTPSDLVRETLGLIPGSQFNLMRRVGHLPCVEKPAEYAALITGFLRTIGHI